MERSFPDRLVVVSPHLDDGVLSLGAFLATASRSGCRVTVLTVFGGDPDSRKPAGGWDSRAGFATEGEAVQARRAEDRAACAAVGAEPVRLSFSEADYRERLDEGEVHRAVSEATDAHVVLLPGFPLGNPDHAWVTGLLLRGGLGVERIGLYAEQPYRYWAGRARLPTRLLEAATPAVGPLAWARQAGALSSWRTKRAAIREYRSQLPLLGLDRGYPSRLDRMLAREIVSRGEAIAWVPPT
jgi:LmbE family N-acetylglucosaminyl deacetylase